MCFKLETEPLFITHSSQNPGGIVGETSGMQNTDEPPVQVVLTLMGVDQLAIIGRFKGYSHSVDGEISADEVILEGARGHHR